MKVTATQSSTLFGAAAGRAVDGNMDSVYAENTCTSTKRQTDPWWSLSFAQPYKVLRVRIINRADKASWSWINGFTVQIGEAICAKGVTVKQGETKEVCFPWFVDRLLVVVCRRMVYLFHGEVCHSHFAFGHTRRLCDFQHMNCAASSCCSTMPRPGCVSGSPPRQKRASVHPWIRKNTVTMRGGNFRHGG